VSEYEFEPVRGLPGRLPAGEHILWQGAPDFRVLMRSAFHGRLIAIYFGLLALAGLATGSVTGAAVTVAAGLLCLGVIGTMAWLSARTTVYTLTNKRLVLRVGVAIPKCFNLPLKLVQSANLKSLGSGHGDIALTMGGEQRIAYLLLWPHARPLRFKHPQPMLRSVPSAHAFAAKLARACADIGAIELGADAPRPHPAAAAPVMAGAAA
jgi:hypothetical protein